MYTGVNYLSGYALEYLELVFGKKECFFQMATERRYVTILKTLIDAMPTVIKKLQGDKSLLAAMWVIFEISEYLRLHSSSPLIFPHKSGHQFVKL